MKTSDHLFRRNKGGKPTGPWIAWGYGENGERWQESTRQRDRRAAEARYKELERKHASPDAARAAAATVADGVQLLLDHVRSGVKRGKRAAATVTFYEQKVSVWRRCLGDDFRLAALTAAKVDEVLELRRGEEVTEHTIAKELVALRRILKLSRRAGLWKGDLGSLIPIGHDPEYVPRKRWLSEDELAKLLDALQPNDRARAAFAVATSARRGELTRAMREDVVPWGEGFLVTLRGTKTEASARTVPVVDARGVHLVRLALKHGQGQGGHLLRRQANAARTLAAAAARLGLPHVTMNDLRRTFAQWLRRAGVGADLVAPAMGHVDTKMVDTVYGELDAEAVGTLTAAALGDGAAIVQQTGPDPADPADPVDGFEPSESLAAKENRSGSCGARTRGLRIKSPLVASPEGDGNAAQEAVPDGAPGGAPASAAIVQQPAAGPARAAETRAEAPAAAPPPNARQALLATLTQALGAFVEAGDLEAAMAVHETIGRLLGAPAPAAAGPVAARDEADPAARRTS